MLPELSIKIALTEDCQRIFNCQKIDTLTLTPFQSDFLLHLGEQDILITGLKINQYGGTYFYFLDPAGELLHFENGHIVKVSNDIIKNHLTNLFFKYFKQH